MASVASQSATTATGTGTPTLAAITAATDASVFGVDASGSAYQLTSSQPDDTGTWTKLTGTVALAQVSATSGSDVWGVTAAGEVYRSQGQAWNPQPIAGQLSQLSAGVDGTVWGVHGGLVYEYTGGSWTLRACQSELKLIAVGGTGLVFGLDQNGQVLEYTGGATWPSVLPAAPAALTDISISADGLLWGVDANHALSLYLGPDAGWLAAATGLMQVSAASGSVIWALDTYGDPRLLAMGTDIFSEESIGTEARTGPAPRWDAESVYDQAQSTHLWIVYQAAMLASQAGTVGQAAAALVKPQPPAVKNAIGDPFHDRLCQGLYDADFKDPYRDLAWAFQHIWLGDKLATYKSHFYDPDTGKNWRGDTNPTALTRGRSLGAFALDCYLTGDLSNAGYYLGLALHYLTDATQAMHAGNFTYLSSDPWGWHTEFEKRVMGLTGTPGGVTPPTGYTPTTLTDFDGILVAAAKNAKSKYLAQICPPLVTNPSTTVVDGHLVITRSWETDVNTVWTTNALPAVGPILRDSITYTAQFLVAWTAIAQTGAQVSFMVCEDSGQVLDLPHGLFFQGLPLQQYAFNGGTNQQWMAVPLAGADAGYYRLTSRMATGPLVLDAWHQGKTAGTPIVSWGWNNGDNQKWMPLELPDGSFKWQGKQSGLLLTVSDITKQGAQIQLQPDGRHGQRWISAPAETDILTIAASTLVIDVPHGTNQPMTQLQLYSVNRNSNQRFTFVPVESDTTYEDDEVYAILVACSGLMLDVGPNNHVVQAPWDGSISQRWRRTPIVHGGATMITLENLNWPGLLMSASGNGTIAGQTIVLAPANGQASQLWTPTSVS
jgi:phospholipase C